MYLKKIISLTLLSLFITSAKALDSDTAKINTLPKCIIKDINGQPVNFAEYVGTGQLTIVSFWATWCKPCLAELIKIDNVYEEWQEKYKVRLIAVSVDDSRSAHKVKGLVASKNWTYDVLIDLNSELRQALNVTNPPTTFIIDKTGKIVYTHNGYLEGDEIELESKLAELTGK